MEPFASGSVCWMVGIRVLGDCERLHSLCNKFEETQLAPEVLALSNSRLFVVRVYSSSPNTSCSGKLPRPPALVLVDTSVITRVIPISPAPRQIHPQLRLETDRLPWNLDKGMGSVLSGGLTNKARHWVRTIWNK